MFTSSRVNMGQPCFFGRDACYEPLVDARVVKYSRNYNLLLTLLNEDATQPGALLAWDIEALIASQSPTLTLSWCPRSLNRLRTH